MKDFFATISFFEQRRFRSGKTNCVLRFVNGQFRENYIPTVEDTYRQVVSCNKQITTLQITDT